MIQRHLKFTNSQVARRILLNWEKEKVNFKKVFPHEYKRALGEVAAIKKAEEEQEKLLKMSGEGQRDGRSTILCQLLQVTPSLSCYVQEALALCMSDADGFELAHCNKGPIAQLSPLNSFRITPAHRSVGLFCIVSQRHISKFYVIFVLYVFGVV